MPMISVEDARRRILETVDQPLEIETIALEDALGRVVAEPISARITQPPFAASAMDGYAVRAQDVVSVPAVLDVIGEAPAGRAFGGIVGIGQAVRIFTGAPVPEGADTIVIQEDTQPGGDGRVRIVEGADIGRYIRPRGLDFSEGDRLIEPGRRLVSRNIALAAAMNVAKVRVFRKPRIAILATGDELVLPGGTPRPDQIISSNNFGLRAMIRSLGGEPIDLGIAADTIASLKNAGERAAGCDVLVTLGGASVGDHDLVQAALTELGLEVDFWRIAMRPGKPLMFGRLGDIRVFGLPGNPVSALVCARLFVKPMIDGLSGLVELEDPPETARLATPLSGNDRRQDYVRARLYRDSSGDLMAEPFARQDSSMLRTLSEADALIIRMPHAPAAEIGEIVEFLPLDF